MNEELDDQYLDWLYEMVGRQARNVHHNKLMAHLLSWEFVPMVEAPSDENRCADGIQLRRDFLSEHPDITPTRHWMGIGCSVLEVMIGLTRRLSFEMDGEVGEWFWELCDNLGLVRHDDRRYNRNVVDQTLERLVWRQYSYDGRGGLFPLKHPHNDQRHVELWFQMESYMLEMS